MATVNDVWLMTSSGGLFPYLLDDSRKPTDFQVLREILPSQVPGATCTYPGVNQHTCEQPMAFLRQSTNGGFYTSNG